MFLHLISTPPHLHTPPSPFPQKKSKKKSKQTHLPPSPLLYSQPSRATACICSSNRGGGEVVALLIVREEKSRAWTSAQHTHTHCNHCGCKIAFHRQVRSQTKRKKMQTTSHNPTHTNKSTDDKRKQQTHISKASIGLPAYGEAFTFHFRLSSASRTQKKTHAKHTK